MVKSGGEVSLSSRGVGPAGVGMSASRSRSCSTAAAPSSTAARSGSVRGMVVSIRTGKLTSDDDQVRSCPFAVQISKRSAVPRSAGGRPFEKGQSGNPRGRPNGIQEPAHPSAGGVFRGRVSDEDMEGHAQEGVPARGRHRATPADGLQGPRATTMHRGAGQWPDGETRGVTRSLLQRYPQCVSPFDETASAAQERVSGLATLDELDAGAAKDAFWLGYTLGQIYGQAIECARRDVIGQRCEAAPTAPAVTCPRDLGVLLPSLTRPWVNPLRPARSLSCGARRVAGRPELPRRGVYVAFS